MASQSFMLIAGDRAWQVAALGPGVPAPSNVALPSDADPGQIAAEVAAALIRLGYTGQPTLLAAPSAWCLAASMSLEGIPKNDRKALLFRLEEKLPLSAETVVADFILAGERALGICAKLDRLLPLIDALESKGIAIQSVVPLALLAAQARAGTDPQPQLLLFAEEQQLNVMALDAGTLIAWSLIPPLTADVALQVDALSIEFGSTPRVRACEVSREILVGIARQVGNANISILRGDLATSALREAAEVLAGKHRPWVDLRRGPLAIRDPIRLYRRPLNTALAAAAIFLLVLAGALFFRAHLYDKKTIAYESQMVEAFHREFPSWQTPPNVRAVVESESRKILAQAPASAVGISGDSALQTLQATLGRLPETVRVRVERMMFTDTSFEIEGRLRAYEDIDALATAARQAAMEVPPPQIRRDNDGFWGFVLRGTRAAKTAGPRTAAINAP